MLGQINGCRGQVVNKPQNVGQCLSVYPSESGDYECNGRNVSNSLSWENNLKTHTVIFVFTQMTGAKLGSGREKLCTK